MILSGNEIKLQHEAGTIVIEPWDDARVNPNSYNVSLAPELMVYTEACLDPREDNRTRTITIPEEGMVLTPGKLYLGRTNEWTETYGLVPKLEGRSSIGRLGLFIHVTAGYGDVGFRGYWTLEIVAVEPIRIYPNMQIGQLSYHPVCGEITDTYRGKYQGSREIVPSRMYREMEGKEMTRKGILDAAEACVCGQREQDYGSPEDNFRTIAELWRQYIQTRCVGPGVLVDLIPEDVAAMMILLKVGRIAGGSASQDNWVDIAGYAACGGEIATKGAAEALREPDEPFKNGRSQEHFEELRNLISDMSVVEIASHIETDNLSEYLGIWRYHAQKELLSIRQLFLEEDNP